MIVPLPQEGIKSSSVDSEIADRVKQEMRTMMTDGFREDKARSVVNGIMPFTLATAYGEQYVDFRFGKITPEDIRQRADACKIELASYGVNEHAGTVLIEQLQSLLDTKIDQYRGIGR
jgi:hypothetical protein